MKKLLKVLPRAAALLLALCLIAGVLAEEVASADPQNGVLEDEKGLPIHRNCKEGKI